MPFFSFLFIPFLFRGDGGLVAICDNTEWESGSPVRVAARAAGRCWDCDLLTKERGKVGKKNLTETREGKRGVKPPRRWDYG